ncbi:MAG TPA: NUDIX hydrolase [Solirubrobacteraceae bacterium]|nr:NUDIX hydrolase [Solirubrobacteraceae bacterium]
MTVPLQVRRAAIRCAYVGLRVYWFVARPKVVGVKCVVMHDDQVLLVRHTYGHRGWDIPGGTVRRREVPIDAARREMQEELGRRIEDWQDLGVLYITTNHHRDNLHMFKTRIADRHVDIDLTELAEASWFRRDELPPDTGRFVGKILARAAMASES